MSNLIRKITIISFLSLSIFLSAENTGKDTLSSLMFDTYLHPIDIVTPYTLKKGEWFYAQPVQTFPIPGWAFWGVTDKLTFQLDFTPFIGGLFFKPNLPIPSVSAKYNIVSQQNRLPAISLEGQFFHIWDTLKRFDINDYTLYQQGTYSHLKLLWGYKIKNVYLNMALGGSYINSEYWKKDSIIIPSKSANRIFPNYSIGIDIRANRNISYHIGFSHGSTLTYFENTANKNQFNYGIRISPFSKNKHKLLKSLRIELISINAWFEEINEYKGIPIPIYLMLYWQWH